MTEYTICRHWDGKHTLSLGKGIILYNIVEEFTSFNEALEYIRRYLPHCKKVWYLEDWINGECVPVDL